MDVDGFSLILVNVPSPLIRKVSHQPVTLVLVPHSAKSCDPLESVKSLVGLLNFLEDTVHLV
jgi:hypothetical protein